MTANLNMIIKKYSEVVISPYVKICSQGFELI